MTRVSAPAAAGGVSTWSNLRNLGTRLALPGYMPRTISRIARCCQLLAIAVVGFSPLAAGCNNPCTPGETRCLGDRVLGTCVTDGDRDFAAARWDETTCTVACREVD